jgi:5-methylcytosine-specific restriction enzyme A
MPKHTKIYCQICGKLKEGTSVKFCSLDCYYESRRNKPYHPSYSAKICVDCGNSFTPSNPTGKRCNDCSKNHTEKIISNQRIYLSEWRKKNPEYSTIHYWKNPAKERIKSLNRFYLKRSSGDGITLEQWEFIKKQFNHTCPSCHKSEPEIKLTQDHIVPIKLGGEHSIKNLQPLCLSCNAKKGIKIIKYAVCSTN